MHLACMLKSLTQLRFYSGYVQTIMLHCKNLVTGLSCVHMAHPYHYLLEGMSKCKCSTLCGLCVELILHLSLSLPSSCHIGFAM